MKTNPEEELQPLARERRNRFLVWHGGGAIGPFDAQQLAELAGRGEVNAFTPAIIDGHSEWRKLRDFIPLSGRAAWPAARVVPIAASLTGIAAICTALIAFPAHALTVILAVGGLAFYFLPTLMGLGKRNTFAIFVLNLFAGWTFVGWVVSIVWACTKERS